MNWHHWLLLKEGSTINLWTEWGKEELAQLYRPQMAFNCNKLLSVEEDMKTGIE